MSYTEFMVACMFQVKRFYCEADYNFYNHLALTPGRLPGVPDSVTLLEVLLLLLIALHYDRTLGDLEWEVESTTVTGTHSSADWWDLLLALAFFLGNPSVVQTWAGTDRVDVSVQLLVSFIIVLRYKCLKL